MGAQQMRFEVLGPVRAWCAGDPVRLGAVRQGLVALLLARPNEPVPAARLVHALWGDDRDAPLRSRLHVHVSKLRTALGAADRVAFADDAYTLRVEPGELDAERFDALVDEARALPGSASQRCAELLRAALDLWRGDPFQRVDLAELHGAVAHLTERRLVAGEELLAAELACGRHAQVIGELRDLVGQHPFRERLHALLMTALYRSGRQADALAVYRSARRTLVEELGLEPGRELRAVERRILAGEPVDLAATGPQRSTAEVITPAQLPPVGRCFVGRDAELAALDKLLGAADDEGDPAAAVAVLTGTAGVGKTALALRWAHSMGDRFSDGQLYVDLRGYGPDEPLAPHEALGGLLRALGVDGAALPNDLGERTARLRSIVAGRRILLVLDNARSVEQVRPLLPGSPRCPVLVTSRDALIGLATREGAERIVLDRLPADEACRLVDQFVGRDDRDPAAVAQLVDACARLPLALRIAAERARGSGDLAAVVAELGDEHARLDLLDAGGDTESAVRAVFSWSYRLLPADVARLFRFSGLHPGTSLDVYSLHALAGNEQLHTTRRHLDVLLRTNLIDRVGAARYQPHDLLRTFAAELTAATDSEDDRQAALDRLGTYYVDTAAAACDIAVPYHRELRPRPTRPDRTAASPPLATAEQATAWLDAEVSNIVAVAHAAAGTGSPDRVVGVSGILRQHLHRSGDAATAQIVHRQALAAAREHGDGDGELAATLGLAGTDGRLGDYEAARDHYLRAVDLAERVGSAVGAQLALLGLGNVDRARGRNDAAYALYERALELTAVRGIRDPTGMIDARFGLGIIDRKAGRYTAARERFEEALATARRARIDVAERVALANLADTYLGLGEHAAAVTQYHEALELARRAGDRDIEYAAQNGLGNCYRRQGCCTRSVAHHERALEIARRLGNTVNELATTILLGHAHRLDGRLDEAAEHYRVGLDRARQAGNRNWTFEAVHGLGRLARARGDAARALAEHRHALDLALELGSRADQARAHDGLACAHIARGEHAPASEHWRQALDILTDLGIADTDDAEVTAAAIEEHLANVEPQAAADAAATER